MIDMYVKAISQNMKQDPGQVSALGKMVRATKNNCFQQVTKITAPVLLVAGDKDPDFNSPKQEMEEVGKQLSNSKKVEIKIMEGLSHYCVSTCVPDVCYLWKEHG